MSDTEQLISVANAAENELARLTALATEAVNKFESRKLSVSATEFAKLKSEVEQAQLRIEPARKIAAEKRALADAARAVEQQEFERETVQRQIGQKQAEIDGLHAEIKSREAELLKANRELPILSNRFYTALRDLESLRQRLAVA